MKDVISIQSVTSLAVAGMFTTAINAAALLLLTLMAAFSLLLLIFSFVLVVDTTLLMAADDLAGPFLGDRTREIIRDTNRVVRPDAYRVPLMATFCVCFVTSVSLTRRLRYIGIGRVSAALALLSLGAAVVACGSWSSIADSEAMDKLSALGFGRYVIAAVVLLAILPILALSYASSLVPDALSFSLNSLLPPQLLNSLDAKLGGMESMTRGGALGVGALFLFGPLVYAIFLAGLPPAVGLATSDPYRRATLLAVRTGRIGGWRIARSFGPGALMRALRPVMVWTAVGVLLHVAVPIAVLAGVWTGGRLLLALDWWQDFGSGDRFARMAVLSTATVLALLAGVVLAVATRLRAYRYFAWEWLALALAAAFFALLVTEPNPIGFRWREHVGMIPLILASTAALLAARGCVWNGLREGARQVVERRQQIIENREQLAAVRPALYLRAFRDDILALRSHLELIDLIMGSPVRTQRFEEVIARTVSNWRPVVALGNPHLPMQFSGALKRLVSDDDWQDEVAFWLSRSSYVLMVCSNTANIAWELGLLRERGFAERTIFIVKEPDRSKQFFDHYEVLPGRTSSAVPRQTLVLYHRREIGWTAVTSALRSNIAFAAAIAIALSEMEATSGDGVASL